MSNIIQGIFGNVAANHLVRQAMTEIPHEEGERLFTNGRAVKWMRRAPLGWSKFGNVIPMPNPEPPCAA